MLHLAAHLLTLRAGLLALPDEKIFGEKVFGGLEDTLRVLREVAGAAAPTQLLQLEGKLASWGKPGLDSLEASRQNLAEFAESLQKMADSLELGAESQADWWLRASISQCRDALNDLESLATWSGLSFPSEVLTRL